MALSARQRDVLPAPIPPAAGQPSLSAAAVHDAVTISAQCWALSLLGSTGMLLVAHNWVSSRCGPAGALLGQLTPPANTGQPARWRLSFDQIGQPAAPAVCQLAGKRSLIRLQNKRKHVPLLKYSAATRPAVIAIKWWAPRTRRPACAAARVAPMCVRHAPRRAHGHPYMAPPCKGGPGKEREPTLGVCLFWAPRIGGETCFWRQLARA
jgi:hypothetical protein